MTPKNRREFLKLAGAASTGAALSAVNSTAAQDRDVDRIASTAQSTGSPVDVVHDRRGTNSIKWDFSYDDGVTSDVANAPGIGEAARPLPMSLSDMEFQTAPEIVSAHILRTRIIISSAKPPVGTV